MFSLKDKRILVTGGSSGIGRQIAIDIAQRGAVVVLVARDIDRLNKVAEMLDGTGHGCYSIDLTNQLEISAFVKEQKPFDGVVLNAGIVAYLPVKFISLEKIDTIFDTNYKASVILSQLLIKHKRINKSASLVFISSISASLGVSGTALYASSKAAIKAYSKVVASELASQKIRSNSISPGIIKTPMTETAIDASSDMNLAEKSYPLGYGTPNDVSGLVVYLLSDESKWMTGTDLILDGGLTLV